MNRMIVAAMILGLVTLPAFQTLEESPGETIGAIVGAGAGALLGSQFGSGSGETVATIVGAIAGAWAGSELGAHFDERDRELAALNRELLYSQVAEHAAMMASLNSDIRKAQSEAATIAVEVEHLERLVPRLRNRVEARRKLFEKGVIPKLTFQEEEDELEDYEGQLNVEKHRYTESQAALDVARKQRDHVRAQYRRDIHSQLNDALMRRTLTQQELIKAKGRDARQIITAPVSGTVQGLAVHTEGGVVTAAQELMVIVPEGSPLEIEVMVLNKDSGFIRPGQAAEIKIEAFPFTKYGTLVGHVSQVSADAIEDDQRGLVYPARIHMSKTAIQADGRRINLGPGMSVTVEIKTGKRRVIEYILAPLQRYADESLRER